MKKIFLFLVIFALSFGAKAQSWTPIFGKQRFASGLGVPVKDSTYFAGAADSALVYINPKDAGFYYKYKGYHKKVGTGTVSSIALTMPSAFSVSGSPITNNGTFIVTGAGSITQYIRGDGSLATLNTAAVPESGNLYYTDARARAAISGTSPISVTSGVVSISQASGSTNGYLSSTDWTTFNSKQTALNGTGFVKQSGTTTTYDNTAYYPASNPNGYTSNTGTVTSVALTAPSAFTVTGSPVTTSGTLALGAAGNSTQYIDGSGSLQTFPTMLSSDNLIKLVRNQSGATMTAGTIVYIDGATGNKPTIAKALATSDATSAQTYGAVQADIANNADGYIVVIGNINNINTSGLTEGSQLYLSSTTAGAYTTTKQYAPAHLVYVGIVLRAHPTQGVIGVKIQNGYELDELHNVAAQTPSNNDGLFYESSTSLWKNKSIATVLGYTPEQPLTFSAPLSRSTNTVSIPAATGSANGYLSSTDWTTFNGKQNAITLTTTGSSGSATFVSNTLNVPTYTLAGLGGQPQLNGTGFVKASGTTISYDNSTYLKGSGSADYLARWSSTSATLTDSFVATIGNYTEVQGQGFNAASGMTVSGRYGSVANAPKIFSSDETTGVTHIEFLNSGGEFRLGVEKSTGGQILPGSSAYATVLTAGLSAKNLEFGTNNTKRLTISGTTGAATFSSSAAATNFILTGGTGNTGLYYGHTDRVVLANYTAGGIDFETNGGSINMTLFPNGNLGIGSSLTDAGYKLDVNGTGRFANSLGINISGTAQEKLDINGALAVRGSTAGYATASAVGVLDQPTTGITRLLSFGPNTSTLGSFNFYIAGANNTSGTTVLTIANTGAATFSSSVSTAGLSSTGTISLTPTTFAIGSSTATDGNSATFQAADSNYFLRFKNAAGTSLGGFYYDGANLIADSQNYRFGSRVGIGNMLYVAATSSINAPSSGKSIELLYRTDGSNDYAFIQTYDRTNSVFKPLRISGSTISLNGGGEGNVGIGTISPVNYGSSYTVLNVYNPTNGGYFVASAAGGGTLQLGMETTVAWIGTTTGHPVLFQTGASERMRITSGGNVLVGTTTDDGYRATFSSGSSSNYTMYINQNTGTGTSIALNIRHNATSGTIRLINFVSGSTDVGSITSNGTVTAYNVTSDYRLKEDLKPINGLDLVNKIKIYDYKYKSSSMRMDGVLAHELQEILPYAVTGVKDGEQMQSVDYSKIVPVMIQAIKELNQKITNLEAQIKQ